MKVLPKNIEFLVKMNVLSENLFQTPSHPSLKKYAELSDTACNSGNEVTTCAGGSLQTEHVCASFPTHF